MPAHDRLHFLTPSYRGDLERFLLLRRSIKRFAGGPIEHIVAVPAADRALFSESLVTDAAVRVIAQQQVVPRQFYAPAWVPPLRRLLGRRAWRLERSRFAGRPGWIVQQVVKLSAPELVGDGAVCIVDSDLLFVRPFTHADVLPPGGGRVLLRDEPRDELAMHREHMKAARRLLGLAAGATDHHYMAYPAVFYGDWVRSLRAHLERVHGRPWQQVLWEAETLSEYQLYGVYLEEVLRPAALQVRCTPFHLGIWTATHATDFAADPVGYVRNAPGAPLSLVFQSNLGIDVAAYRSAVERLLD